MNLFSSSNLLSGLSTGGAHDQLQGSQVLTFRPSPNDPNATIIDCAGYPLFAARNDSKAKFLIYRIGMGSKSIQPTMIGSVSINKFSGSAELSLHGQTMKLRRNQMSLSDEYLFTYPPGGKMRWRLDSMTGSTLHLVDGNGQKLARYHIGFSGDREVKSLEILVPCNDIFLDLVVLSGRAAGAIYSKEYKDAEKACDAADVVSALSG